MGGVKDGVRTGLDNGGRLLTAEETWRRVNSLPPHNTGYTKDTVSPGNSITEGHLNLFRELRDSKSGSSFTRNRRQDYVLFIISC